MPGRTQHTVQCILLAQSETEAATGVMAITHCPLTKTEAVSKNAKLEKQGLFAPSLPTKPPPSNIPKACLLSHSSIAPASHQIDHFNPLTCKVSFKSLKGTADAPRPPIVQSVKVSPGKDTRASLWSEKLRFIDQMSQGKTLLSSHGTTAKLNKEAGRQKTFPKFGFCGKRN